MYYYVVVRGCRVLDPDTSPPRQVIVHPLISLETRNNVLHASCLGSTVLPVLAKRERDRHDEAQLAR